MYAVKKNPRAADDWEFRTSTYSPTYTVPDCVGGGEGVLFCTGIGVAWGMGNPGSALITLAGR